MTRVNSEEFSAIKVLKILYLPFNLRSCAKVKLIFYVYNIFEMRNSSEEKNSKRRV